MPFRFHVMRLIMRNSFTVEYNMPEFTSFSAVGTCNEHFQRPTCKSQEAHEWTGTTGTLWAPGFCQTEKAELGAESWAKGAPPKLPTADTDVMDLYFTF